MEKREPRHACDVVEEYCETMEVDCPAKGEEEQDDMPCTVFVSQGWAGCGREVKGSEV